MTRGAAAPAFVGIDAQLAVGTATGIGEYVRGLIAALRARGERVVALEFPALDPWRFDRRVLWDQVLLPLAAARAGVRVLHCASGTMPAFAGMPVIATVHDVAWLRVQQHVRAYARAYFGPFALARYARAARIVVDSAFSRAELLDVAPRLDPARVSVAYPGVAADVATVVRRPGDERVILAVGTVERRKNLEVLVRALPGLPGAQLVAVGPFTPYRDEIEALARELAVDGRVDLRGYVPRAELLALYATAAVAAMPSRYEGFGYGAAQALCAGVPLVASNASSLPEVVGADAPLVPPDDADAWRDALAAVFADRDAAERRAAAARAAAVERFAWGASADRLATLYRDVAGDVTP